MEKDEPTIQRRSVLAAFHNDLDDEGQLKKHDFRYLKTNNQVGQKIGVTKWFSKLADVDQAPRDEDADLTQEEPGKKAFYSVKHNNVILVKETPTSKKPKAIKFRLLTHYRPHGFNVWFRIIHPTD
ncbi:hypothetical protein BWI97_07215 [Siphonobacter sp. BAB-5405]|uniref:hypothetical protein n=1 Tax=Siphonobacter sp. BAB-5405 TaxID=1864825 RepID=UPI000C7F86CC|nr:hypothetical protein [Siphonobacter sp. BAB-5405]PMD97412.1 hypothetical protein BWI97_07215 [Siphonobacter sp. BAB-5405]